MCSWDLLFILFKIFQVAFIMFIDFSISPCISIYTAFKKYLWESLGMFERRRVIGSRRGADDGGALQGHQDV